MKRSLFDLTVLAIATAAVALPAAAAFAASPADPNPQSAAQAPTTRPQTRPANDLPPLFDPELHLRTGDVRIGMTGYGLSVFQGTDIRRFKVEVVGVLRNTQQLGTDVVLIEAEGETLEISGPISGMSGSPIYLHCEDGKDRLVGAFAFGWPYSKITIAGVQPIEAMLRLEGGPQGEAAPAADQAPVKKAHDLAALGAVAKLQLPAERDLAEALATSAAPPSQTGLSPLTLPVGISKASPTVAARLPELLAGTGLSAGLVPMSAQAAGRSENETLAPGSPLVVPLLMGDLELTAVGTCTTIIGDHVFGFGHPLFDQGDVELPMAAGSIDAVIPLMSMSFKLGSVGKTVGTLRADATAGIAGTLGAVPELTDVSFKVIDAAGDSETFHFQAARHDQLTPSLLASALLQAVTLGGNADMDASTRFDLTMTFATEDGPREVVLRDAVSNRYGGPTSMALGLISTLRGISTNPFSDVTLESVTGQLVELPVGELPAAQVMSASLSRTTYAPGETVRIDVLLNGYRGERERVRAELVLPDNLPPGTYPLRVMSATYALQAEASSDPALLNPRSLEEVFAAYDVVGNFPNDALYLRLDLPSQTAVAVGSTSLSNLPPSKVKLLATTGRPDVLPAASALTKRVEVPYVVVDGEAVVEVTIERR